MAWKTVEDRRAYVERNRDAIRERDRVRREATREARRERDRVYRAKNRTARILSCNNYYIANRERLLKYQKDYQSANPGSVCANQNVRKARKRQACPLWADLDAIRQVYARSAELRALGIDTHVDHIVALHATDQDTGEHIACGLHVHWNLRVILDTDNSSKGCKLTDDVEHLAILEWA